MCVRALLAQGPCIANVDTTSMAVRGSPTCGNHTGHLRAGVSQLCGEWRRPPPVPREDEKWPTIIRWASVVGAAWMPTVCMWLPEAQPRDFFVEAVFARPDPQPWGRTRGRGVRIHRRTPIAKEDWPSPLRGGGQLLVHEGQRGWVATRRDRLLLLKGPHWLSAMRTGPRSGERGPADSSRVHRQGLEP